MLFPMVYTPFAEDDGNPWEDGPLSGHHENHEK